MLADRIVPLAEVRSWLEELLVTICVDNSLPFPAVNVPLLGYEVDFLWKSARFVVEADGGDHLDRDQRDRDNHRDFTLQRAGYLVRRYSSRDMSRAGNVVTEVLGILSEREGGAGRRESSAQAAAISAATRSPERTAPSM